FASGADGAVSAWSLEDLSRIGVFRSDCGKIRHLEFSPDGDRIALSCEDASIRILDKKTLQEQYAWLAHGWACNVTLWNSDGNKLISGSRDAHIRVWDANQNFALMESIPAHHFAIY